MVRISLIPSRTFLGSLFPKPVTGQELFFAVSYSKPALVIFLPHNLDTDLPHNASHAAPGYYHKQSVVIWIEQSDMIVHCTANISISQIKAFLHVQNPKYFHFNIAIQSPPKVKQKYSSQSVHIASINQSTDFSVYPKIHCKYLQCRYLQCRRYVVVVS